MTFSTPVWSAAGIGAPTVVGASNTQESCGMQYAISANGDTGGTGTTLQETASASGPLRLVAVGLNPVPSSQILIPVVVQHSAWFSGSGPGPSITLNNVQNGNWLIIPIGTGTSALPINYGTTAGSTTAWTTLGETPNGGNARMGVGYAKATATGNVTIQVTCNVTNFAGIVYEVANVGSSDVSGGYGTSNTGSSTTPVTQSLTTALPNVLLIAVAGAASAFNGTDSTPGMPWTISTVGTSQQATAVWRIVPSGGISGTVGFGTPITSMAWSAGLVDFVQLISYLPPVHRSNVPVDRASSY